MSRKMKIALLFAAIITATFVYKQYAQWETPTAVDVVVGSTWTAENVPCKVANPPSVGSPGVSEEDGFLTLDFDKDADEQVYHVFNIPSNYNASDSITFCFDFMTDATVSSKTVVWGLEFKKITYGDRFNFGAGATTTILDSLTFSADGQNDLILSTINMSSIAASQSWQAGNTLMFRPFRDANNGADDLDADARAVNFRIEFKQKIGQ